MSEENKVRYWARRPHNYGGVNLDRGQILREFGGFPNDAKLIDLGYLVPVMPGAKTYQCQSCGEEFAHAVSRDTHFENRHINRGFSRPINGAEERVDNDGLDDSLFVPGMPMLRQGK